MWRRKQAAALFAPLLLAWLTGDSSEALSSFGVSNSQLPPPATTTPPGRPCSRQNECAGVSGSSCVRTHDEAQTRCLCGDNNSPVNGQCEAQARTLYHLCANSYDCNDGLICDRPNNTNAPHLRMLAPTDNICLCDHENGYKEKDHTCSDADIVKMSLFAILVVTCIRKLLVY